MENTRWRILDIFVILAIYAVVMAMFYAVSAALFGADFLDSQNSPSWFPVLEGLVEFSAFVFLPVFIVTHSYHAKLKEIGLDTSINRAAIWVGIFSGVVLWATVLLVNYLIESVFGPGPTHPDIERLSTSDNTIDYLFLSFPILILTPISEEVYARGFVYTVLRKRYGIVAAMVASSALFAAFHLSVWFFMQAFVAALGMTWLREKYNSLMPAMIAHAVVNLLSISLFA